MFDFDENAPITKKEMLQINRYIKKQNRLRAAAIKRKQDKLYKDIAFMFKKYETKLNRKQRRTKHFLVVPAPIPELEKDLEIKQF